MLAKLVWKSFRIKIKNYIFYFISMIFSVMVFYSFTAILSDQILVDSIRQSSQIMPFLSMGGMLTFLMLLVFMVRTNRFFMEQNEEELSVYTMLGIRKKKLYVFFAVETFLMGLFSLSIGILLGVLYSKLFAMILVKAMGFSAPTSFFVSWSAIQSTIKAFCFILLILAIQTIWIIRNYKLAELAKNQQSIRVAKKITILDKALGFISPLLLIISVLLTINFGKIQQKVFPGFEGIQPLLRIGTFIFLFFIIGTFLFYSKTSLLLYDFLKKRKKYYMSQLHSLSINMFANRMSQDWNLMSMITIFLTSMLMIIIMAVFTISFVSSLSQYKITASFFVSEEKQSLVEKVLAQSPEVKAEVIPLHYKTIGFHPQNGTKSSDNRIVDLISESNYRKFQQSTKEAPVIEGLVNNEAVQMSTLVEEDAIAKETGKKLLTTSGQIVIKNVYEEQLDKGRLRYGDYLLVVSDAFFAQQAAGIDYTIYAIQASKQGEDLLSEEFHKRGLREEYGDPFSWKVTYQDGVLQQSFLQGKKEDEGYQATEHSNYVSRFDDNQIYQGEAGVILYVTMFVGMAVIVTTASMLSLRQISALKTQKHDFYLLKRLGITNQELNRMLRQENLGIFLPPIIAAIVFALAGMLLMGNFIKGVNYLLPLVYCGVLTLVYAAFYIGTTIFCKRELDID